MYSVEINLELCSYVSNGRNQLHFEMFDWQAISMHILWSYPNEINALFMFKFFIANCFLRILNFILSVKVNKNDFIETSC